MSVMVIVNTELEALVTLALTVTSVEAFKEPVPTVVSPTFKVTVPAVPLNPPNFAEKAVIVWDSLRVVVNVMLVAGLLPEPTCVY